MCMNIIKRDGQEVPFNPDKIRVAITKANESVAPSIQMSKNKIEVAVEDAVKVIKESSHTLNVEEIQDIVVRAICGVGAYDVAESYITYRYKHQLRRNASSTDGAILSLIDCTNEEIKQENSNKNSIINSVQRDYIAGETSKDITNRILLPHDIVEAHKEGIIHFHDADYFVQRMFNCCLVDLEGMFNNHYNGGTSDIVTALSGHGIASPKSFATAANIATQAIAQIASNQYGGQTITLTDFVGGRHSWATNFVDVSRKKWIKKIKEENKLVNAEMSDEQIGKIAEMRLEEEIKSGIQLIQYQLVTLQTTNGQAPFITIFMYLNEVYCGDEQKKKDLALLIRLMLEQRIKGVQDKKGNWIGPAFPKLIYVLQEDNIEEGSKYWDLTVLAAKCTAKRMVPDYMSEKVMLELKGEVWPPMGCRSFLSKDTIGYGENGEHKYYGRFNCGVVTINLPDIALSSGGDEDKFWEIFDERMEKYVHVALQVRHKRLRGTISDVSPIHWQDGAIARLQPGETIDKLLYNTYSTLSIGYAGLYETVLYMKHCSHTSEEGREFAIKVLQFLNDKANKWKAEENIGYAVYGTPLESTTYKFAKCLQNRFGIIPNITDHEYITNSYHICVREEIDAFSKLSKEAEFQALSGGGAISYCEVPNLQNNIPAVLAIMKHIYNTIIYAELNTKSDLCTECGYDGEIQIVEDNNGKLIWKCPNCGCTDQTKMHVARRTCGLTYRSTLNE